MRSVTTLGFGLHTETFMWVKLPTGVGDSARWSDEDGVIVYE